MKWIVWKLTSNVSQFGIFMSFDVDVGITSINTKNLLFTCDNNNNNMTIMHQSFVVIMGRFNNNGRQIESAQGIRLYLT